MDCFKLATSWRSRLTSCSSSPTPRPLKNNTISAIKINVPQPRLTWVRLSYAMIASQARVSGIPFDHFRKVFVHADFGFRENCPHKRLSFPPHHPQVPDADRLSFPGRPPTIPVT